MILTGVNGILCSRNGLRGLFGRKVLIKVVADFLISEVESGTHKAGLVDFLGDYPRFELISRFFFCSQHVLIFNLFLFASESLR